MKDQQSQGPEGEDYEEIDMDEHSASDIENENEIHEVPRTSNITEEYSGSMAAETFYYQKANVYISSLKSLGVS